MTSELVRVRNRNVQYGLGIRNDFIDMSKAITVSMFDDCPFQTPSRGVLYLGRDIGTIRAKAGDRACMFPFSEPPPTLQATEL